MRSLTTLLQPYPVDTFLAHHWTKRAIAISNKGQRRFDELFCWNALNDLLNFHVIAYPNLRLAIDGKVLDEAENVRLSYWCQKGATLILNGIHKHVPALAELTAALKYDLGYGSQVNAYASFAQCQGFSCHYDTHDVLILQLEGSKAWSVFDPTLKYPLPDQPSTQLELPQTDPTVRCVLQPGDVLYIPRGHWHHAIAQSEPSPHLTVGIHCKTGIDFLEWLVNELRQQEEWRESLPIRDSGDKFHQRISKLTKQFCKYLVETPLAEQYGQVLEGQMRAIAPHAFPQQAGFDLFPNGRDTRFYRPAFQRAKVQSTEQGAIKILVVGKEVLLSGVPALAIELLFSQTQFTGRDVIQWFADFDWEIDLVPLLSRLVLEGILFVDTGARND